MTENNKAKRHQEENVHKYYPEALPHTNTQMLISIANSLKDIVDELSKYDPTEKNLFCPHCESDIKSKNAR